EPRLAFKKTVVTRYRISLEQRHYAPSTINLRLAAVRRLAYEASDCGLLSPDLAAGIRRVKGARRLGVRIGNWLTAEEGRRMIGSFGSSTLTQRRNRAMIAVLIGCGLRRAKAAALKFEDVQLREEHWVIADSIYVQPRSRNFWHRVTQGRHIILISKHAFVDAREELHNGERAAAPQR